MYCYCYFYRGLFVMQVKATDLDPGPEPLHYSLDHRSSGSKFYIESSTGIIYANTTKNLVTRHILQVSINSDKCTINMRYTKTK